VFTTETDRMRAKLVPLAAAQQAYRANLAEVNSALKVGAISQAEYGAALARTKAAFAQQVTAIQGAGSTVRAGAGAYRNFGFAIQGAGYQIGDFAVQVASGQNPLRA